MRICLLGDYSNSMQDEGMKNVSFYLWRELQYSHSVLCLDVRRSLSLGFWRSLERFRPQVIHYIPGPSLFSFLLAKMASTCSEGAPVIVSAYHPGSLWPIKMVPILRVKPRLILTVSKSTEEVFRKQGCNVRFLGPGVDINRFVPASVSKKMMLREKYGIEKDKFVILHVGHIKQERNIRELKHLQKDDTQVIIIGSNATRVRNELSKDLMHSGCMVLRRYLPEIQEIYALSDCYVFPTKNRLASIELPLSILEAMSCNLPVVCTKFGAIPSLFKENKGLKFFDSTEDLLSMIREVMVCPHVDNRNLVLPFSWSEISSNLEKIYEEVIN